MSTTSELRLPFFANSTIDRSFSIESVRRAAIRALALLAPEHATELATRLFASVPRIARSESERASLSSAVSFSLPFVTGRLALWRWGEETAPRVLLMHGWGGRGAQLRAFVEPLLAAGYAVVTFDAPGHGDSAGEESSFVHFAQALEEVVRRVGPFEGVIAHSMGAAVTAYAMSRSPDIARAVLIAPPASLTDYSHHFAHKLGFGEKIRRAMQRRVETRFGIRWAEFEAEQTLPRLSRPGLIVHDANDVEVPLAHGERYAATWSGARLLRTSGLGHRRILKDRLVIDESVRFLKAAAGRSS